MRSAKSKFQQDTPPNSTSAYTRFIYTSYNVQEVVYQKNPDGRISLAEVTEKPFFWFEPKSDGSLIYRNNYDAEGVIVDTDLKFLLTVRNATYQNPYGEALLSRLYWPWFFRVNGWKFWVKALERTGTPFLKGTAPDRTDQNGKRYVDYLQDALTQAQQNAVLSLPEGWTAEFMSATQTGNSFEQFEQAVVKRIQKVILGQTLTSDVGQSGSYAAAKVHDNVRQDRRNSDIRLVSKTVQQLVNALHRLNGFTGNPPVFVMDDGLGIEQERATRDATLVQAGILQLTEDYILRCYDYEPGEVIVTKADAVQPDQQAPLPASQDTQDAIDAVQSFAADKPTFTPEQQQIEKIADDLLANVKQPLSNDAIKSVIMEAKDPGDLEHRLAILLRDSDFSEFTKVLEKALFTADVMGYAHAE